MCGSAFSMLSNLKKTYSSLKSYASEVYDLLSIEQIQKDKCRHASNNICMKFEQILNFIELSFKNTHTTIHRQAYSDWVFTNLPTLLATSTSQPQLIPTYDSCSQYCHCTPEYIQITRINSTFKQFNLTRLITWSKKEHFLICLTT